MSKLTALRKTGKWGRDDYPQSGWQCVDVRLGHTFCDMCEVQKIVYVHVMTHPSLPGVWLQCGLVCVGHMRGNLEYAKLREGLFKWQYEARKNQTPAQKLRRKGWRSRHYIYGSHEWTLRDDREGRPYWQGFIVRVSNRDGWRLQVSRDWWDWRDKSRHIHGGPFESAIEAAMAGIEQAELLRADLQWMADGDAARAAHRAAQEAEREAKDLDYAVRDLTEGGHLDLVEKLKCGGITISDAYDAQGSRSEVNHG